MKQVVVIVDPRSSGTELAPTLRARGVDSIAIRFDPKRIRQGYGVDINRHDFIKVFSVDEDYRKALKELNPSAVIAGAESGVPLARSLERFLTPSRVNPLQDKFDPLNKMHMQRCLESSSLPFIRSIETRSAVELERWLKKNELEQKVLVMKPPISAGSESVVQVEATDYKKAFWETLSKTSNITGKKNERVVVQEKMEGVEYAVGTVSVGGKHYLSHLIEYKKECFNGRSFVYDRVKFIPFRKSQHSELWLYTQKCLDALGVKWGASHSELLLTDKGPRLVESTPRMCGGPVVRFSREASGCSQADKIADSIVEGRVLKTRYEHQKYVMPVFLRAPESGKIQNVQVLENVRRLTTFFEKHFWKKENESVSQTVDYLSCIGIIALSGPCEKALYEDYLEVRELESQLRYLT